jgi:hypothetical protein
LLAGLKPYKSIPKFIIALIIEISCLTAFVSSIFIIVNKSDENAKKIFGKAIVNSSLLFI